VRVGPHPHAPALVSLRSLAQPQALPQSPIRIPNPQSPIRNPQFRIGGIIRPMPAERYNEQSLRMVTWTF
jgi:hypothetical protein